MNVLYPPFCLHCKVPLEKETRLCPSCLETFTLLPPEGRCQKCFAEIPVLHGTCKPCREISHIHRRYGVCFDAFGPASSLLRAFMYGSTFYAKEIASYIVVQLHHLQFPDFDCVTMLPNYFQNSQYLIGKELANLLQIPFQITLKRYFSPHPAYCLKKRCNIMNQNILLLNVIGKDRQSIYAAYKALATGWPETIFGMAFCHFID